MIFSLRTVRFMTYSAIFSMIALLLWAEVAMAAEHAAATTVSFASIIDYALKTLAAVLMLVIPLLIRHYLNKATGIKLDSAAAAALDFAVNKGVSLAIAQLRIQGEKIENVNVHNELVKNVADYAISRVPDAVARFNATPDALAQMALARLEERLNPPAAIAPPA